MKQTRPMSPRAEGILRELVGPKRKLPTLGMIAAGAGKSRSHICYILLGRRNGTADCLRDIAGYLGVTMEALMTALARPKVSAPTHRGPRGSRAKVRAEALDRRRIQKRGASALARLKALATRRARS